MKLVIESNGTLHGTRLNFSMEADEPMKIARRIRRRRKKALRRRGPTDIIVPVELSGSSELN